MRRSDHPSRPSATIWCCLSSPKTLLMPAREHAFLAGVNVSDRYSRMAGFQLSINGRFWVSTEAEDRQVIAEVLRSWNFGRPAALLDSTMFVCDEDTQRLCIGRSAGIGGTSLAHLDRVLGSDELRDAFTSANRTARPLGNIDVGLEMVRTGRLVTPRDLWTQLQKKDLVLVTAPTYALDRQQVFVYTERLCGRCGGGMFVFLERQARQWLVVRCEVIWIG